MVPVFLDSWLLKVTMYFSPGEKPMRRTYGWLKRISRPNSGPPQTAAPCRCTVASICPRGDHCTKLSVQKAREYTSSHLPILASFHRISVWSW